ncbi:hypothetical protein CISIN_1g047274mg, partial [Citrus sinensis]
MGTLPLMLPLRSSCIVWLLVFFSLATSFKAFAKWDDPSVVYTYNRFAEIQEKCGPVLSSASELKPDDDRSTRIRKELSFVNGDWEQEPGGAPLMPFDDKETHRSPAGPDSFLKLASFWVVDVDPVRRARNTVSVSGIIKIDITERQPFSYRPGWAPKFCKDPGFSSMTILFEGVYIESEENGGERLLCLLGTSMMPTTTTNELNASHELVAADVYGDKHEDGHQPPLVQDDQIMLVLRYRKTFSLMSGNISGEMKSLHERSDLKYFDRVHLSSHLDHHSKYQFGAEELVPKACSPYPYQDSLVDEEVFWFKDDNICNTLRRLVSNGMFDIVHSWTSVGSNDDANRFGPFVLSGMSKDNSELARDPGIDENNIETARVFALFRLIHSWEDGYTSASRTGLSGLTLSAEGMWRSSEGQLCMIGCLGIVGTTSERCNSRICLYFPLTFTITQRTAVFGAITSLNDKDSRTRLWFEMVKRPDLIIEGRYKWNPELKWSYKYSKIIQAKAFQTRSKPSVLAKLFLQYPYPYDGSISSLSFLADETSLFTSAVPCAFPKAHGQRSSVTLRVLSSGPLFGRYSLQRSASYQVVEQSSDFSAEMIEASGHLSITGEHFNNISLSFEGIYDSTVGKMYLVACRDVRNIQKNFKEEVNLERGMDCQFEVKVEYPPKDTRWLKNPDIRISVCSKRSKDDPLYFEPVNLKSDPIYYSQQDADVILRKTFEEILMLTMASVCTRRQLHYINNVADPIAYISRAMIYIPAVDYISPLISTGEIFFKWKVFESNGSKYDFRRYERFRVLGYIIKVLSLYTLLLTFSLGKKVSESHTREIAQGQKQQRRLPNEKRIILITSAILVIGFLVTQVIRGMIAVETMSLPDEFVHERSRILEWLKEIDGYLLLVPDLFLLPQVVANTFWRNRGKPLRKLYYIGLTSFRVVLHVYDYIRDPVPDCSFGVYLHYPYSNLDLYSKLGNIVVAVIVIILALIVYKQQKSNHRELNRE